MRRKAAGEKDAKEKLEKEDTEEEEIKRKAAELGAQLADKLKRTKAMAGKKSEPMVKAKPKAVPKAVPDVLKKKRQEKEGQEGQPDPKRTKWAKGDGKGSEGGNDPYRHSKSRVEKENEQQLEKDIGNAGKQEADLVQCEHLSARRLDTRLPHVCRRWTMPSGSRPDCSIASGGASSAFTASRKD